MELAPHQVQSGLQDVVEETRSRGRGEHVRESHLCKLSRGRERGREGGREEGGKEGRGGEGGREGGREGGGREGGREGGERGGGRITHCILTQNTSLNSASKDFKADTLND